MAHAGTKIGLAFPKAGKKPEPVYDDFTVVGYFKSGMSEYDSTHVYVPLERLQKIAAPDQADGKGAVNPIQIKVRPGVDLDELADRLQTCPGAAHPMYFRVWTWEQKQGPLSGGGGGRAEHPEHSSVLHHRGGRVRHPGHLLDDRGREDPRHRRDEGPGGLDRGRPRASSWATACCWAWSAAAWA